MRTYHCQNCGGSFTEADNLWDVAIDLNQCPKCLAPLKDFSITNKPEHIRSSVIVQSSNSVATLIVLILIWALSAFVAYLMALFSINQTIINTVILTSVACIIVALILATKQKTVAAFIIAIAPAPATICFAMSAPYVARFINNVVS